MTLTPAQLEKFQTELAQFKADGGWPNADKTPTTFIKDGNLLLSTEDGELFADFYGDYRDGRAWTDPRLVAWATKNGGYWEWQNPSCMVLNLA